jgi:hypothetical protein
MIMSARIKLAALAAVLTTLSLQGAAFAQNYFPAFPAAPEHRFNQTVSRMKAKIPSNAFGSVNDRAGTSSGRSTDVLDRGGNVLGRDPDPNVRFELLRDQDRGK